MEDYEVLENLGMGHQGDVQKVKRVSSGEVYALKIFRDETEASREIYILRTLSVPNCDPLIVCYQGVIELEDSIGLLTEYVPGKNLRDLVKYHKGLSDDQLVKIARHIFSGLSYIHSRGIVHNDIAPNNFVFNGDNLKLIDFGLACFYGEDYEEYKCEPEKTTDNLFELETDEINYNRNLYPKLDVIMTGIMLWKFKNPSLGTGKLHYFIPMTKTYQNFISGLEMASNRPNYYILHASNILAELQNIVDDYSAGTNDYRLEQIFRRATLVDPYSRPGAATMVDFIDNL